MSLRERIKQLEEELSFATGDIKTFPNTITTVEKACCEQHGQFDQRIRTTTGLVALKKKSQCPACLSLRLDDTKHEKSRLDAVTKHQAVTRLTDGAYIPKRFADASFSNYEAVNAKASENLNICKSYAENWRDRLKQGGGLVMCGTPGTGKNHLAVSIAKHVIQQHQSSVLMTTALRVARAYKRTWRKDSQTDEDDVIKHYLSFDLLIIDEIGVQFGSDSEEMILFEVINGRYEAMKPTILISNKTKDQLAAYVGERVIDRMNEGGGATLVFTWDSYRSSK